MNTGKCIGNTAKKYLLYCRINNPQIHGNAPLHQMEIW